MWKQLSEVFSSLKAHDVRYVVIGGIAVVLHGVPRATFDLDILIEATPENAGRLLDALWDAGILRAKAISARRLLTQEIVMFRDRVNIDVQTRTPGLTFADAWKRRVVVRYEGRDISLVCREDLIAAKRACARPRDLEDIAALTQRPVRKTRRKGKPR